MALTHLINQISERFEAHSDSDAAMQISKYMKDQFVFYGIKSPQRRALLLDLLIAEKNTIEKHFWDFIEYCWSHDYRDWKYIALDLLMKRAKSMEPFDIEKLRQLIIRDSWWDTVDMLATHCIGSITLRHRQIMRPVLDTWNTDSNIWIQRTSIIHQVKYRVNTDSEQLSRYILNVRDSKEFFLQKAAGWALREYSKFNPTYVKEFVDQNVLPALTRREALRILYKQKNWPDDFSSEPIYR